MPAFEAVIGLEIHAQLKTVSKIFSADATDFNASDNENISPVSLGMPGTLPVINRKAVEYGIKMGLALGCQIRSRSVFARKNYFYPDLPKGYQISQHNLPLCENGEVFFHFNGQPRRVRIERAHLEEDAGKSQHFGEYTLVNYNRAGVPLLEIVSAPDMHFPAEAAEYARTVHQILLYLEVCDGNMEEGSLRCDCNVSIRPTGTQKLGTKVELKNINSFRFIEKAIEYEIDRQIDCIEQGQAIVQETRLWDPDKNRTLSMRSKEDAQDYRYFPDPDLLPLQVSPAWVAQLRSELPELAWSRSLRFRENYGLSQYDSLGVTAQKDLADYFEVVGKASGNYKAAANWILTDLLRELNSSNTPVRHCPLKAEDLGQLIAMIDAGQISGKIAKSVFVEMWSTQQPAEAIIKKQGLIQISDPAVLGPIIAKIIQDHPAQVRDYNAGKTKLFGFFVGALMKASKGQANPDVANQLLTAQLVAAADEKTGSSS